MHLAYAEAVSYPGGLVLKRIRGSINQTCADTGETSSREGQGGAVQAGF